MNKTGLILLMTLGVAAGAYAQTSSGGITVSNDPAKVAAVEKHAQELKARPAAATSATPTATHTSSHKAKPAAKPQPAVAKPASKT